MIKTLFQSWFCSAARRRSVLFLLIAVIGCYSTLHRSLAQDAAGQDAAKNVDAAAQSPAADANAKDAAEVPNLFEPELPLYEQEAFDIVVLDEANENARLKILYLPLPNRQLPINPPADSKLVIRLVETPDDEYEIAWRNIRKVELFEEMLLAEGNRLINEAKLPTDGRPKTPEEKAPLLDEAFHYLFRVKEFNPKWPGLNEAIDELLFWDAANLMALKRLSEAFAIIEELYGRNPNFRLSETLPPISDILSRVLDRILNTYFEEKNYLGIRSLLKGMTEKYGDKKPAAVETWSTRLSQMAEQKRDEGRGQLESQKYRAAIDSAKEMMNLWPDVEGGQQFNKDIAAAYPIVFVGVTQPALEFNSQRIDNWAARRTGRLVHRTLVEFLGAGPEGGQYDLSLGSIEHSDDRRRLILRLNQPTDGEASVTGYDVARRVRQLATPGTPEYSPAWHSLVSHVTPKNVFTVEIELRRSHVLPEAYLRVPLVPQSQQPETQSEGNGPFRVQSHTPQEIQFANKAFAPGSRLAEIVEVTYERTQTALGALRRGEVDVLDRLFPADALRARAETSSKATLRVEPYSLPTVHVIVPNLKNPFLDNRDFRRGMLIATNRENILRQELMGGRDYPGFQVISGPFPASATDADPLGYAYDEDTSPMPYNAMLGKALTLVGKKQVLELAKKRGEPEPTSNTFIFGYPGHELARVACQAIASQWQAIGLEIETREFPPGVTQDTSGECDLVYKEIAIWEPVTDARRILGPLGVAPTGSPYVLQSLRWLDAAQNWGNARVELIDIHRAVYNDIALLPLWQTVDFFAYRTRLKNIGASPVWLYQNVEQWRISAEGAAE